MRLLSKYLVRETILPFIFSLLMITFVLFINFLLRAIDRFLGKGLELGTILEYLFLNMAWIIALSVPMAVLLASLMTFGRMSEDNEINAIKLHHRSQYHRNQYHRNQHHGSGSLKSADSIEDSASGHL